MTTKMTERDKKLLLYLACIIVIVIFTVAVFMPQMDISDALDAEITAAEDTLFEQEIALTDINMARDQAEIARERWLEAKSDFYELMSSSQIDKIMTNIVQSYPLNIRSVSITMPENAETPAPFVVKEVVDDGSVRAEIDVIYTATVDIVVDGDGDEIQAMIDEIFANYAALRITSLRHATESSKIKDNAVSTISSIKLELYMCGE